MYKLIPFVCGVIMLGLGLFMAVNPKGSTRKDKRDDPAEVAKVQKSGFGVVACGIVLCIIAAARMFLF